MLRGNLKKRFTAEEYLAMETVAEYKSEFFDGAIYAMTGGTPDHSIVSVNCVGELRARLAEKPCFVFNSDMRLNVEANGLYTYPDAMVVCGKVELVRRRNDTITNPVLIVEVLSESTRGYDRGPKFNLYQQLPTLQETILVESVQPRVECYRRTTAGEWTVEILEDLRSELILASISCTLPLGELYRKTSWT